MVFNTVSGYLVNFDFYQGNNPNKITKIKLYFGKCIAPFYEMLNEFPTEKINLLYKFFFFLIIYLIIKYFYVFLSANGYNGTGTIRINYLPKNLNLWKKS